MPVRLLNTLISFSLFLATSYATFSSDLRRGTNVTSIDSTHLAQLSKKSNFFYRKKNIDSSLYFDRLLLKEASHIKNLQYIARAANNLAYYHKLYGQKDSSFYYYNFSKNLNKKAANHLEVGKNLLSISLLLKSVNDFFGAKQTLVEAITYLKKTSNRRFLASAYNELGTNNKKLLNYDDAIFYYKKAIGQSDKEADIVIYKNNLALVYKEQEKYGIAATMLGQILEEYELDTQSVSYSRILHNKTYCNWKNGETDVVPRFLKALQIRLENKDYRGLVSSYTDLSEYYSRKDRNLAKSYLDSLILVSKKTGILEGELDALKLLVQLDTKNVTYRDRYIYLRDSLYAQDLKVNTKFAKMMYDDQIEKRRLAELENRAIKQAAILAEQKSKNIFYLALASILLIAGISFIYILRQRYKKEKLTAVYDTEKRISERLHDGMSNDFFEIIIDLQQNDRILKEQLIDKLDKVYRQTRNISHENSSIITGSGFFTELKKMFTSFQADHPRIVLKGMDSVPWEQVEAHKCIVIHRAVRELLINMKKHSSSKFVVFQFDYTNKTIHIRYQDNQTKLNQEVKKGIGLLNTENRIEAAGGQFIFVNNEDGGIRASISIPVS